MGLITSEPVAVVENSGSGMKIETYFSLLEMVKEVMNHGGIGGGECYGDEKHLAALVEIESHLAEVRQAIKKFNGEAELWEEGGES